MSSLGRSWDDQPLSAESALALIADAYAAIRQSTRSLSIRDHGMFQPELTAEEMRAGVAREVVEGEHFRLGSADPSLQRFLFNEARARAGGTVIEFGTCFGVSTAALAFGLVAGRLVTIEADPALVAIARATLRRLGLSWVEVIEGTFSEVLPKLDLANVCLVFDDGDHTGRGERERFRAMLGRCAPRARFVWDDIRWSSKMLAWWREVAALPNVSDVYDGGRFAALTCEVEP